MQQRCSENEHVQTVQIVNRYAQVNVFPRRVAGENEGAERLELIEHGKTYGTL